METTLENSLQKEKQSNKNLEELLTRTRIEKEYITDLCNSCTENVHKLSISLNLNNTFEEMSTNELKYKDIKFDDQIKELCVEKYVSEKECSAILNYINSLIQEKDVFITEREKLKSEITNYEMTKSDYLSLQEKYEQLSHCDDENSLLKTKISDFEINIVSLEKEIYD